MRIKIFLGALALGVVVGSPAAAQRVIYDDDLAWKLASPGEIREVTGIRARLKREAKEAVPIFVVTPPPFEEIGAAPNEVGNKPITPKSWELPPWPTVDPPIPNDAPEYIRRQMIVRQQNQTADIWGDIGPAGDSEAPSQWLRPRNVPLDQQIVVRGNELPPPFSLRRYYDNEDIFFEVAAYGGTTSFKAEKAYRAMKEAATKQTSLDGLGTDAFLTRVEILEKLPEEEAIPFADLAPSGEERPDLLDSGRAEALTAPAFQDVPVKDLEGRTVSFTDPLHKDYRDKSPQVKQSLLVIVAFYPDKSLTVSVAMEERLGTVQDLVAVAMMVQRKISNELKTS